MSIRNEIVKYLESQSSLSGREEIIASEILGVVESLGLDLTEWLEDSSIEKWTKEIVESALKIEASYDCLAIAVIYLLENEGLSLSGNGWLDDDPLAEQIIDEFYDAELGKIKTSEYQKAYDAFYR